MFGNTSITGIDIGTAELGLVELVGTHKKQLKNIAITTLPAGIFEQGLLKDETQFLQILKSLCKSHKMSLRGRKVAIALGGSAVIIRMVTLPNKGDVELADLIEIEAEQHFQHDLNDLYFTWQVIGDAIIGQDVPVVLVGAKKIVVDQYISMFKKLGCKVRIIDCDVFAQLNMLEFNYGVVSGLIALVSIAAATTQVTFISSGSYLYSREIAFGSNNYVSAIAEAMAISLPQAGTLLHASRSNPAAVSGALQAAIALNNEQLATEIQLTIDFFFRSVVLPPHLVQVDQLFLGGSAAYIAGVLDILKERVVKTSQIINPLSKISVPDHLAQSEAVKFAAHLGTATGLALREDETSTT
jgi:type IV pilus assembly protein PilM